MIDASPVDAEPAKKSPINPPGGHDVRMRTSIKAVGFSVGWIARPCVDRIARTETADADVAGQEIGWIKSGLVWGEKWHLGIDPCVKCIANSEAGENGDGVIQLGESWPFGAPAVHPHCECAVAPVLLDTEEAA